jgi:outer membrane immunogenic protein
MKTVIFAAMAAACCAAPAFAQDAEPFTGPRVGAIAGYDSFGHNDGFTYGAAAGFDLAVAPNIRAGIETTLSDSTTSGTLTDVSRDLTASARLGYVLTPQIMAFGKVGYASTRLEDKALSTGSAVEGVRFGGGLEYALTPHTYISAEYQRTEYESNVGGRDAGLVGVGFRF